MNTINGRTPEEIQKGQSFSEYLDESLSKVSFEPPEDEGQEQKKRTPEEIKKGLECGVTNRCALQSCPYWRDADDYESCISEAQADALAYIQQLEAERDQYKRERNAAVRTARWQFERRSDGSVTELPVCSGCGATPKYYAPMNDVGMQVPPYCHECGSRMAPVVKLEVEK